MPELDSLRGVAILSVVLYHGLFWSNNLTGLSGAARAVVNVTRFGWLGVNLFFVLSGFLITGILLFPAPTFAKSLVVQGSVLLLFTRACRLVIVFAVIARFTVFSEAGID
jgi:surface polysaccharide O-acyltransferase-like enzyme